MHFAVVYEGNVQGCGRGGENALKLLFIRFHSLKCFLSLFSSNVHAQVLSQLELFTYYSTLESMTEK